MTMPEFETKLSRQPVADTGQRVPVTWQARPGAHYAHAYPAAKVDGRHHLCQGVALSKLIEPGTTPGTNEIPLYSPSQIRSFMAHQRHKRPVCGCCYGVLYWMFGEAADTTVRGYRLMQRATP